MEWDRLWAVCRLSAFTLTASWQVGPVGNPNLPTTYSPLAGRTGARHSGSMW